jgi:hypothetical protein
MTIRTVLGERCRDERGVIAVVIALFLTVLIGMAALVVDLAVLRQDRAADRQAADFVATAAATALARTGGTAEKACQDGWAYFLANVPDSSASVSAPNCTAAFAGACDPDVGRTAVGTAGSYTVSITIPVTDDDPALAHPDVVGGPAQASNPDFDGAPCERVGVQITRNRKSTFASVLGSRSVNTNSRSVARVAARYGFDSPINLLLLDPTGCNAFTASGQASIVVHPVEDKPGYITIDSDGKGTGASGARACTNANSYTIDASGNQNSSITALGNPDSGLAGVIRSYALTAGQGVAHAYDPNDVTTNRLTPKPTASSQRTGRAKVDWAYNCLTLGLDGLVGPNPATGINDDCIDAPTKPSYIAQLNTAIGPTSTTLPAGYTLYPRVGVPTDKCSFNSSDAPVTLPPGNYWVNCPSGFSASNSVTFTSGNIVFQGSVSVGSQGSISINNANSSDSTVYLRSGGSLIKGGQGSLALHRTFVYLANGAIDIGAGIGAVTWTAPVSGNFSGLALWSESALAHGLGGQASISCVGVFFMPNADPFTFTGQGTQAALQIQLITYRLTVAGQGTLDLVPVPTNRLTFPAWGGTLIR